MPVTRNIPSYFSPHVDTRAALVPQLVSWPRTCHPQDVLYSSQPSTSHRRPVLADGRIVYDEKTGRIKRPRNPFIFFRSHINSLPDKDWKSNQNGLSKRAGEIWEQMTIEEKAPFVKMADEENLWYAEHYPDYAFKDNLKNKKKAPKRVPKARAQKNAQVEVEVVITKAESMSPVSVGTPESWTSTLTVPSPSNSTLLLPPSVLDSCDWSIPESSSQASVAVPQPSKPFAVEDIDFLSEWTTLGDVSSVNTPPSLPVDFQFDTPQFYPPPTPCALASPFLFDPQFTSFTSEFGTTAAPSEVLSSSWFDEPQAPSFPYYLPEQPTPSYSPTVFEH